MSDRTNKKTRDIRNVNPIPTAAEGLSLACEIWNLNFYAIRNIILLVN